MAITDGFFAAAETIKDAAVASATSLGTSTIVQQVKNQFSGLPTAQGIISGLVSRPTAPPTNAATSAAAASTSTNAASGEADNELRVRLSPLNSEKSIEQVYGKADPSNILTPLRATNGLMFPYSPQITFSQSVSYSDLALVHTNTDYLAYQKTPAVSLTISGKFTVQTQKEGAYALACIHFLRTVSKMYFGGDDPNRGLPPPMLLLNGYGSYMFNNLRVLLKSHSFNYNETMDTVLIRTGNGTVKLPALFDLSMELVVQQTPRAMRKDFDLNEFRTGALMLKKGGWI